jgi:hypothetical protein
MKVPVDALSTNGGRESAAEAARVEREVVRVPTLPIEDVSLLYNMPPECCRSLGKSHEITTRFKVEWRRKQK